MTTPLNAIRAKCLDCSAGSASEVKTCPITTCPLYPYRLGKNPNREGIGNLRAVFPNSASNFSENSAAEGIYTPATKTPQNGPDGLVGNA